MKKMSQRPVLALKVINVITSLKELGFNSKQIYKIVKDLQRNK